MTSMTMANDRQPMISYSKMKRDRTNSNRSSTCLRFRDMDM